MRVMFVIVLERQCEITHRGRRIGFRHEGNVIALHGFDKALSHPVALRTAHRCRYRFKPDLSRKCPRLTRQVRTAVVGEPLNRLLRKLIAKTLLDGCQHIASRSQQSSAKVACTVSWLSQRNSKPSEHQR